MALVVNYQVRFSKEEAPGNRKFGTYSRTLHTREFRSVRAAAEFISKLPSIGGELHSVRRVVYTDLSDRERWMLDKIINDMS